MDKEIKYLLEEIKDNTYDYVGTNGCLYQDLSREELNLLLNYINNLEQQCKQQKEVIDKLNFIKNRKNQGASQENINKMAIKFVNSYLKEVSEWKINS